MDIISAEWLRVCVAGETENCVETWQLAYLGALVALAIVLVWVARRSRDLSTATLSLIPIAIAINIAVGSLVVALKLPIYLDSIGTVMVGALAGPWAGALTGLLANLIWAFLPVPGGAGPIIAFFAPVAAVIGLMAGWWSSYGVFRLGAGDERIGRLLAVAAGIGAAAAAFTILVTAVPDAFTFDTDDATTRSLMYGVGLFLVGAIVAWASGRTVLRLSANDTQTPRYLAVATGIFSGVLVALVVRLLFGPTGYFSTVTGEDPDLLGGANLTGLTIPDPTGMIVALAAGVVVGIAAWTWTSRGERARLFPVWVGGLTTGLVAAAMSAPIAAYVFGGVTGSGVDALVTLFRSMGLSVLQASFAQGLTSDPFDKTVSYTVVFLVLAALPITLRTMFSRGETTVAA